MASKKLSLQMDDLKVESFTAGADAGKGEGTVRAHGTYLGTCFEQDCAGSYGAAWDTCKGPSCVRCPSDTCVGTVC
ncbi:MAG TPA: hypothetical protein VF541_14410 [Longimicrobium sp.]